MKFAGRTTIALIALALSSGIYAADTKSADKKPGAVKIVVA